MALQPLEWKDRPALMEHLFPVQKISAESYKEQMAASGKTLTALGSYWKGRKPLVLNKACVLGTLLPVTDNLLRDLEIFEMLMAMDDESMRKRTQAKLAAPKKNTGSKYLTFNEQVRKAKRAEELDSSLYEHIWNDVNEHLNTSARSITELVEQIGRARYGHRPRLADIFSGSGQIPFEAARLGCDVYASDLNPIACMLTWGDFNIVGGSPESRQTLAEEQKQLVGLVQFEIDGLGVETNKKGWKSKCFLYCVEVICPQTGWKVPLIPNLTLSKPLSGSKGIIVARLIPNPAEKQYDIDIIENASADELRVARKGTVDRGDLLHSPDGVTTIRINLRSIRGDYREEKQNRNRLRLWEKADIVPRPEDIYQERLYCVYWNRLNAKGRVVESKFASVTPEDLAREQTVTDYVASHLSDWQEKGYVPDMLIEVGTKTREPIRTRGWTHWHHLFNPRQLLQFGLYAKHSEQMSRRAELSVYLARTLNWNSRLCMWNEVWKKNDQVFYNQALNTIFYYGCRSMYFLQSALMISTKSHPLPPEITYTVQTHPARDHKTEHDIYITDPPYGDAVKYEEITEFFIAWLRKNPPREFASWTWDSRRSLAIKGEDEEFRQDMIAAYRRTAENMPDNGIQILMFTHQSGSIWADMANIVWASGLQVTAAWYVVTETDSALRAGAHVKGTVLLVLRKRHQHRETFRDDLGWEIESAVKEQVDLLVGLDKKVREQRSEGLYSDADLQMAGYAAAIKVLTAYSVIDGKDMVTAAEAPRQKGKKTFVDQMIDLAVQTAVQFLVPVGFEKGEWQKLQAVERYYLKMTELEHQSQKTLDNYQNFAKAFKVHNFDQLMSNASKANSARLKLAGEFKTSLMSGDAEIAGTPLRALLYAMYETGRNIEIEDILFHLMENCPNYMQNKPLLEKIASYLAQKRGGLKGSKTFEPEVDASAARVLAEAIRSQRL